MVARLNEPWPPRGGPYAWRRDRARFARRMGVLFALVLVLMAVGVTTVVSWLFPAATVAGPFVRPQRICLRAGLARRPPRPVPPDRWAASALPLGGIVEAADRVAEGDYSVRAAEHGPPWMRTVARAFNSMTSKLQAQDRPATSPDGRHRARAPDAARGAAGTDSKGCSTASIRATRRRSPRCCRRRGCCTRLVDDLRTLAHTESGTLALQKESTDIGVLINDVRPASFADERRDRNVTLDVTVAPDPAAGRRRSASHSRSAHQSGLQRLRHTPPGGRVTRRPASARRGDRGDGQRHRLRHRGGRSCRRSSIASTRGAVRAARGLG